MISLVAKLMMYILGTVRMSLLHMIMMRRMTLLVVLNINRTAYIDICNVLKSQHYFCKSTCLQCQCNCTLYCCSLHNTVYYPVSTALSLTPPTTFPSLRSVCHIPALFTHTLSICYDPHTIATLPAADSHTVSGYHTDTVWTVLAVP